MAFRVEGLYDPVREETDGMLFLDTGAVFPQIYVEETRYDDDFDPINSYWQRRSELSEIVDETGIAAAFGEPIEEVLELSLATLGADLDSFASDPKVRLTRPVKREVAGLMRHIDEAMPIYLGSRKYRALALTDVQRGKFKGSLQSFGVHYSRMLKEFIGHKEVPLEDGNVHWEYLWKFQGAAYTISGSEVEPVDKDLVAQASLHSASSGDTVFILTSDKDLPRLSARLKDKMKEVCRELDLQMAKVYCFRIPSVLGKQKFRFNARPGVDLGADS